MMGSPLLTFTIKQSIKPEMLSRSSTRGKSTARIFVYSSVGTTTIVMVAGIAAIAGRKEGLVEEETAMEEEGGVVGISEGIMIPGDGSKATEIEEEIGEEDEEVMEETAEGSEKMG